MAVTFQNILEVGLIHHPNILSGTCENSDQVGTHILQFFWSSAFAKFSHPLAYFITNTASTEELLMWFWEGVELLEQAGFIVVATIMDGGPANRRFQV